MLVVGETMDECDEMAAEDGGLFTATDVTLVFAGVHTTVVDGAASLLPDGLTTNVEELAFVLGEASGISLTAVA